MCSRNGRREERLLHYRLRREHFLDSRFEMPLPDFLADVRATFGGCGASGLDHSIFDVTAADDVSLGETLKIDVGSERGLFRMDLQLPDFGSLLRPRHLKKHMRSDTPLECGIEVCGEIRCKDHDTVERLQFAKKHIHSQV